MGILVYKKDEQVESVFDLLMALNVFCLGVKPVYRQIILGGFL